MSTVIAKNIQIGTSGTPAQNFTWYQPASPDGTIRLGVGNSGVTTGDVITATSAGVTVSGSVTGGAGSFTTLAASSTVSGTGFSNYLASPPAIGGTTPAAVSSTNLSYTGTLTGGTGIVNFGSGQFYKDASGNVGIGTSSTPAKVTIATTSSTGAPSVWGTGQFVVSPGATTTSTGFGISVDTTNNVTYVSSLTPGAAWRTLGYRANEHIFYSIGTNESARIDSSGRLLVNNTGNTNGYISVTQGTYYGLQSNTTSNGAGIGHVVFTFNNTTTCGTITTSSGNSTAYNTSSDYRLKENVQPMVGALARVAALKPVTYKWKSNGDASEGFIAHELAEVCPQAVSGEKDAVNEDGSIKPQGIDTSFLVATLTAAIQEQQALIESLTARIAALEAK